MKRIMLSIMLFGVAQVMKVAARLDKSFARRLAEHDLIAQIQIRDGSIGRYYILRNGKISSGRGLHPSADIRAIFRDEEVALKLLTPPTDYLARVNAMKTFTLQTEGDDALFSWFMETIAIMQNIGTRFGTPMQDGSVRYVNQTNGGPVFVYVKDGRILRITPMDFDKSDAEPFSIDARGKRFTPARKTSLCPHGLASKSMIYSKDRLLYPMKRVDFDPQGERNPQNRGISGYERISWDEALDLVVSEIRRSKKEGGQGAVAFSHPSHHTWGNIGYYLSAFTRFINTVGGTKVHLNPDSWEGWYWGAVHHWGYSMRLGGCEFYGTVEDCLKESEMIVFWSSDPETTNGVYGGFEGTMRRQWAQELGLKMVHIDPYKNTTASLFGGKWIPIRAGTDAAMAHAIAHVWMSEGLYDEDYVARLTTGFEMYEDYVLGKEDGIPKTPEWQESETGVPARDVRALAREWGSRKTYLAAGGPGGILGGATRTATGIQWARSMVYLMAMQGLGKPGVNMGSLQTGTPLDTSFYFPGYAEGGMSGELAETGAAVSLYQRAPHLVSMNPSKQKIPRLRLPEAIMEGHAEGYPTDPTSMQGQFRKFTYPAPGEARIEMLYRYGSSSFGTMTGVNRWVNMYRSENLPFVVNQSIWNEGEVKFADLILPACTNFERIDIGEWANAGGYVHDSSAQLNHRVITIQHKCIEPLGESRSDFEIFYNITQRLGLGSYFAEASTELDWCRRMYEASDLKKVISWRKLLRKGYYVVPPVKEELRAPTAFRWFAEGRKKDVPEPHPLPADYTEDYLSGLQTRSGKIEFESSSLKLFEDPERPPLNRYVTSWEGPQTTDLLEEYPLQLISPHTRFSFHTAGDGKDTSINDIKDHRVLIDGYYYLVARINPKDAESRGVRTNDLIRLFNDRGAVICAALVTERIMPGTIHAYQASAVYDPLGEPGASADRGGCVNILTPSRLQSSKTSASACGSCLIQVETWNELEEAV